MNVEVFAAGAVPWRTGGDGTVLVGVVHRPRYDDWTFPKGKRDPGETDEDCARREVWEETGIRGELGEELPSLRYVDNRGRSKLVRYWAMVVDGRTEDQEGVADFTPNDEVDALVWVPVAEADRVLSYPRDRVVLEGFARVHLESTER